MRARINPGKHRTRETDEEIREHFKYSFGGKEEVKKIAISELRRRWDACQRRRRKSNT